MSSASSGNPEPDETEPKRRVYVMLRRYYQRFIETMTEWSTGLNCYRVTFYMLPSCSSLESTYIKLGSVGTGY